MLDTLLKAIKGKKTYAGITIMAIAAATGLDVVTIELITDEIAKILAAVGTILAIYGRVDAPKK